MASAHFTRVVGLDVARAVALLGMYAAHVGDHAAWPWLIVSHGRPSALFAVLAGASISLMLLSRSGGTSPAPADAVAHTRVRVATRGAILVVAGYLVSALGTPVDVILTNLGLMFVMALPALTWRTRTLGIAAATTAVVGQFAVLALRPGALNAGLVDVPVVEKLWSDHYPAITWIAYIWLGMAIGRLALNSATVQRALVLTGAGIALAAYGTGAIIQDAPWLPSSAWWDTVEPHSYSPFEILGNMGVAMAVIGAACWLAPRAPHAVWPLAAAGSMAFTLYVLHVVVIAIAGDQVVWEPSNVFLMALAAGAVGLASLWKLRFKRGPLESLMARASRWMADSVTRTTSPIASRSNRG